MKASTPQPDREFKTVARKLRELLEGGDPPSRDQERTHLETILRNKFAAAFGLSPDRGQVAARFFARVRSSDLRPKSALFDHTDLFRRGTSLVLVSQPYGFDEAELKRWAADTGASHQVANDWGYYYPGHASLFLVEFTLAAKFNLGKLINSAHKPAHL